MVEVVEVEEPLPSDKLPFLFYSILLHPNPPYVGTSIVMIVIFMYNCFVYFMHIYVQQKEQNFYLEYCHNFHRDM